MGALAAGHGMCHGLCRGIGMAYVMVCAGMDGTAKVLNLVGCTKMFSWGTLISGTPYPTEHSLI